MEKIEYKHFITSEKKEQEREDERTGNKDLKKFQDYVIKNQGKIEKLLNSGKALDDIFYQDFYNCDIDKLKYEENIPGFQEMKENYNREIENLYKDFTENKKNFPENIEVWRRDKWFGANINGGPEIKDMGRLYFNLEPFLLPDFFRQSVEEFSSKNLHIQIKIFSKANADEFNRFDKMVLYFNEKEEKPVLELVKKLYWKNITSFKNKVPHFTLKIKGDGGGVMEGISFGQETDIKNQSFGSIRSKILAEVYAEAEKEKLSIDNPEFNINESFRKACEEYKVDPKQPAFNLLRKRLGILKSEEKFPEIRKIGV